MGSVLRAGRRLWRPPGRVTNVTLLLVLLCAFGTGVGAVATGSDRGRWVVVAHGIAGLAVVLLVPWKGRVVRRGLRRARASRWASLLLAALAVTALLAGLAYASGSVRSVRGVPGMWLHIAVALALVPLLVWHVAARPARPRRADLSRRTLLRAGVLGGASVGLYLAAGAVVRLAGLPGSRRRFTGSYEAGSFDPAAMPSTIWLNDTVPAIAPDRWRLAVVDGRGRYELTLADLQAHGQTWRTTLDCTSGWYAVQDWTGAPASALLRDTGSAQSLLVHSASGYWVRLPVRDLDRLLLATAVDGQPLSPVHGYPLRLVAPGRRGYWWVKWVDRIELQPVPWWWQPPFPVT